MKIAIISDYNIAGQPTALMRAINKYTPHQARCIIGTDDFLSYDRDIIVNTKEAMEEATAWVKQCDFFHFGRGIIGWPGIDWNKIITKDNCCIKYYGSELRNNPGEIAKFHANSGIAAIAGTDWSIASLLPGAFYHLGSYFTRYGDMPFCDLPGIDPSIMEDRKPVRICCGSAGSPLKRYDLLKKAVDELRAEGEKVELDVIQGIKNEACLDRKRASWVTFTSLHGAWGISGIESMLMGHLVMSCLDPWILSMYPESPTIHIKKETLKQKIWEICHMDFQQRLLLSQESQDFAYTNFNTRTIIKRYMYLIDLIMNRQAQQNGFIGAKNIY